MRGPVLHIITAVDLYICCFPWIIANLQQGSVLIARTTFMRNTFHYIVMISCCGVDLCDAVLDVSDMLQLSCVP